MKKAQSVKINVFDNNNDTEKGFGSFFTFIITSISVCFLTWLVYRKTLNNPFQFDDLLNITKNYSIRAYNFKNEILSNPRWIGELSNKLTYQFWQFDPYHYRLINLIIHLTSGVLFGSLVWLIEKRRPSNAQGLSKKLLNKATWISTLCMIFFLLHPIQTQVVNYVIQARLEGLAALISIISLIFIFKALTSKGQSRIIYLLCALVSGFVACGTKEIVVITPLLAILIDLFFISEFSWNKFSKNLMVHAAFSLVIFSAITYYLGLPFLKKALSLSYTVKNNRGNIVSGGTINSINPFEFFISEFAVIVHYLSVLFAPWKMSVEYDFKLARSPLDLNVIMPLVLLTLITAASVLHAQNQIQKKLSSGLIFSFGWIWFLLALAPRSTIIPCPELACDYKTYLANCGIFWILSSVIVNSVEGFKNIIKERNISLLPLFKELPVATIIALCLAGASNSRNFVWSNQLAFWKDVVEKCPNKARGHNNYGVALCENGNQQQAILEFKKAIELDQLYCDPLSNLAVAYSVIGQPKESIKCLERAVNINPNYPEAFNNLGAVLLASNETEKAIEYLNKAIEIRPHYGKAHLNLGRAFSKQGKREEAWQATKKATMLDADDQEGFTALGLESIASQKFAEAITAFERAIKLGNRDKGVWTNLAGALCHSGRWADGKKLFEQLYKAYPEDQILAFNLASCKKKDDDFNGAAEILSKLKFDQNCPPDAIHLASECFEKIGGLQACKKFLEEKMQSLPQQHMEMAKSQLKRISIQERLNATGGVLSGADLKEIFDTAAQA